MRIKWIKLSNYRQFRNEKDAEIEFDPTLTVIAGANNSGKTSIMELLRNILGDAEARYRMEDIPVKNIIEWLNVVHPIIEAKLANKTTNEENFPGRVIDEMTEESADDNRSVKDECRLAVLELKICVTYDPVRDDIQKYAEYLMDLESEDHYFYFKYFMKLNYRKFALNLKENYLKIRNRYKSLCEAKEERETEEETITDRESSFQKEILNTYFQSLERKCIFCDRKFETFGEMEPNQLKKLFHVGYISASRPLDDVSGDKNFTLSREMVDLLGKSTEWKEIMNTLPDEILVAVEKTAARETIRNEALELLQDTTEELVRTNGGHAGKPNLQIDMGEKDIKELLSNVIAAKYEIDHYYLNEGSQGLGLSNLVYIHLQLQNFLKEYDPQKANLFLLEEPEAHMHPQMQQVFMKYLIEKSGENISEVQGMMTTHSPEMVSVAGFLPLRVVRSKEPFVSRIVDLSSLNNQKMLDWFFEVGYSDIVFADKVILYEGDTERLYLRKLIQSKENKKLKKQYIAFIQVGGAYAGNYLELLQKLDIKTLIITDIDYAKDAISEEDILKSETTNAALKQFYEEAEGEKPTDIRDLYTWKTDGRHIQGKIYLAYQTKEDGRTRTLEEAMLCKFFDICVDDKMTKEEWRKMKKDKNLRFSLPQKIIGKNERGDEIVEKVTDETFITVRDILRATSDGKTDFMYSVLSNDYAEAMQPEYIRKGLVWLGED